MLFQTLDDKNECVGIYAQNKLHINSAIPDNLSQTWSYSGFLRGREIDYAQLYVEGKTLDEVCPEHLKAEWNVINKKLKSIVSSFIQAKVSLKENCFFDLTPQRFLIEYCELRNRITEHVLNSNTRPPEYPFFKRFAELVHDIKHSELNINLDNIQNKLAKESAMAFYKKIANGNSHIWYNMFGSITGRLTVHKNSFPILTFPKQFREILLPQNDWFVVFDMNAAELRTAMALAGRSQIEGDLHQWSSENVFKGQLDRSEAKSVATAWLYDSQSAASQKYNADLSALYDKQGLKNKYWING